MRFADTSFWVAMQRVNDRHHATARQLWSSDRSSLLTTNHVVGETWTFLFRRSGHRAAVRFFDAIERSERTVVVHVDEELEAQARRWLRRHDERVYSFVDATSFVVMRRRRLHDALAFDGDFSAAGFIEVRPAGTSSLPPS